jgi:aldose 1-epimerase
MAKSNPRSRGLANDPSVRSLVAGDLVAVFLPVHGMLGASLRHQGAEILRRVQDLEATAAKGSTAGIPLLHPWANRLAARLEWIRSDILAVFPFRHRLELAATLRPDGLTMETTLVASPAGPVPVSFGFHPYVGLPELPRAEWQLTLPPMRSLVLDRHGIPNR